MGLSSFVSKVNPTTLILGGLVIGAGVYFVNKTSNKVTEIASEVGSAINPVNDENIINQGASKVVNDLTDGKSKDLGSWLFCAFNPDAISCREGGPVKVQEQI